ncbi:hypothetical protein COCON_G00194660 [Conger conger]|uniref:RING-type domain-containing protein n=1 Tax=Conger conger TaxID=82655 RepID=A0A9Q1HR15_CONCO|nr:hypothetical protein COCON_G00194660 [Conger conger]
MAQNIQNVTLSLTLPISCQICLGKVREPVICGNYHVFCSACIDVWLKKASQCPTCRAPITAETPCRKIIGATNESECNESLSIKRYLRKTRAELLLREYEDEIEGLQRENEELMSKNSSMEGQLEALLHPSTLCASPKTQESGQNGEERTIDPHILEEWSNKLRAATDISEKVKQDMEKLKEANKTLRSQNIDLVRDNLRLKAEVENRSPQKFGRYTVAALEAKSSQYERDLLHLRRALERSDKYIEELEAQLSDSEGKSGAAEASGRLHEAALAGAADGTCLTKDGVTGGKCDDSKERKRIVTMRRSLSAMEGASVRTDLDLRPVEFSGACRFLLTTSSDPAVSGTLSPDGRLGGDSTPEKVQRDSAPQCRIPSTPSSSFSCLSLGSPGAGGSKRSGFRPLSYLRRLSFEDCSGSSGNRIADVPGAGSGPSMEPGKPGYWGVRLCKMKSESRTSSAQTEERPQDRSRGGERAPGGESGAEADPDSSHCGMSSEDSMNAAYLDKVSELDSMMSESENGKGSCSPATSAEPSGLSSPPAPGLGGEERAGSSSTGSEAKATRESAEEITFDSPFHSHELLGRDSGPSAFPQCLMWALSP